MLRTLAVVLLVCASCVPPQPTAASGQGHAVAESRHPIDIRGHLQVLHVYGSPGGTPVIVSSGDGGWIHLAPHVAEALAANGCFVVGFDARSYLESFTSGTSTLRIEDEPGDYRTLIDFAGGGAGRKPILIGVSEGAGLSVLAATGAGNRNAVAGVIGLGISDLTELGWRWRDMLIYVTHGTPREPTFSVKSLVDRVAPVPLAAIHSTRDEYASVADVRAVLERAKPPKRLWIVTAANHRFSDNLAELDRDLVEAIRWIADAQRGAAE